MTCMNHASHERDKDLFVGGSLSGTWKEYTGGDQEFKAIVAIV